MGFYEPEAGDRVRVVLEGEVRAITSFGARDFNLGFNHIRPSDEHVVSVEKVEPPVVTFKPGDVVEHLTFHGYRYLVGRDGYYSFQIDNWCDHAVEQFTSKDYRKVELK